MQINDVIVKKWKSLREQGDVSALAKLTGLTPTTISRILSGKQSTSIETVEAIKSFYKSRQNKIDKLKSV